jgi:hypothetical protein
MAIPARFPAIFATTTFCTRNSQPEPQGFFCFYKNKKRKEKPEQNFPATVFSMEFFTSAIDTLKTLVIALGAGLAVWGVINLLEGYGNDNPGAKSQGMKQLMAGAGVAVVGTVLVPMLSGLFS